MKKYYNPYLFPIRVVNDLGKEQVLMPQERGKVKLADDGKTYDQSPLKLCEYKPDLVAAQKKIKGLGNINLRRLTIAQLRTLAWALCIDTDTSKMKKTDVFTLLVRHVRDMGIEVQATV